MTRPDATSRWPHVGLGLVAGVAVAVLAAVMLDLPMTFAIALGAGLGLVGGAVVGAQRSAGSRP